MIVDAGTGLRALGNKLAREADGAPGQYHVLLSHVHWDHIQGLPFFSPAYIPGTQISIYALLTAADELDQVIGGITRARVLPDAARVGAGAVRVSPGRARRRRSRSAAFDVTPIALNHPFGAVGYRDRRRRLVMGLRRGHRAVRQGAAQAALLVGARAAVATTTAIALGRCTTRLIARLRGVDTVVYDTHFLPEEYAKFPHYGHSTPDQAIEICVAANVRRLVLYHHAPSHGDDQMDQIAATYLATGCRGRASRC